MPVPNGGWLQSLTKQAVSNVVSEGSKQLGARAFSGQLPNPYNKIDNLSVPGRWTNIMKNDHVANPPQGKKLEALLAIPAIPKESIDTIENKALMLQMDDTDTTAKEILDLISRNRQQIARINNAKDSDTSMLVYNHNNMEYDPVSKKR